jgi:predicted RNA-binding protein YlxR (DUF448 family)
MEVDPTGRMAGRGAYVCDTEECRQGAVDKGSLHRALEVPIPAELRAELTGEASRSLRARIEGGHRGQE